MPRLKRFLSEVKAGRVPQTLWTYEEVGHTQDAKKELLARVEFPNSDVVFDTPKPTRLIRRILQLGTSPEEYAIALDFFAGTGTTMDAMFSQNVEDGGNRRCILVQLPEPLPGGTSAELSTISDVTKARLRRAAKNIKDENSMFAGDLGFRVFKLASSNIRAWEPDRENLAQTLEASVEHLKTDRTEADILFELLLKLGLDLTVPIEEKTIAGKTVHSIGVGTLLVCLAPQIAAAEVEPLALGVVSWYKQLAPAGETQVVFRDSAFADDVAKTNLTAILQQYGLENVRSL
jgi:adenine-specific DNA-methyltransferase